MRLILASGSPRRRELLRELGIPFEVIPSCVVERDPAPGEDPAGYALHLAEQKARDVAANHPEAVVLAADTVVAVDEDILGKPASPGDAVRMLGLLAGREHTVTTGVAVVCGGELHVGEVTARVRMRPFLEDEARQYVATGEPMDKAGAYAVQGLGGALVTGVVGCYHTVVGLPLHLAARLLGVCGLSASPLGDSVCGERR